MKRGKESEPLWAGLNFLFKLFGDWPNPLEGDTVRVWVGLNLLQAQLMKQMLLDSGIECFGDRDPGVIPAGEFGEIGLWVSQQDEPRARQLLEQMEEEMSADLDRELPDDEKESE